MVKVTTEESKKSAVRNQSQSVPFLQRKFNIFGGGGSSNSTSTLSRSGSGGGGAEKSLRSSGRGSNKSISSTLPRSGGAQKATVLSSNNNNNSNKSLQTKVTKESKIVKREDSETSDTFKGVQSLKQFWNSRIIGGGSNSNKSSNNSGQSTTTTTTANSVQAKSKFRKSSTVESVKPPISRNYNDNDKGEENKTKKKKQTGEQQQQEEEAKQAVKTGDEIDTNKAVNQVTLRQSSSFAKSDNFNKYKTASSVKLHRVSYNDLGGQRNSVARGSTTRQQQQQQTQQNSAKRHTVDSVVCIPSTTKQSAKTTTTVSTPEPTVTAVAQQQLHNKSTLKFPQIATTAGGAKIHWAKREDILESCGKNKRRSLEVNAASVTMIKETNAGGEAKGPSPLNTKLTAKTDTKMNAKQEEQRDTKEVAAKSTKVLEVKKDQDQQSDRDSSDSSQATMAQLTKTEGSRSATPSSISLNSNTVSINTVSRTDSPRKMNATRRASFKTHSGQGQSIRRLAVGSKVAALTNRFNQLIQTDATIMEEVKRKGVVVHRVNGHVYKIKEEANTRVGGGAAATGEEGKRKSLSRTSSNAAAAAAEQGSSTKHQALKRRKSSVKKHDPLKKSSSSSGVVATVAAVSSSPVTNTSVEKKGVKATIEMFEPTMKNATGVVVIASKQRSGPMKPKVPDKSEHVLRRTKELVSTRRDWEEVPPNRLSLRLDEIKEVIEEKALTPIQEALPPVPTDNSNETSPTSTLEGGFKSAEKKDKSVYGRIYEKLKINKSSFLYAKKAPTIPSVGSPAIQISEPVLNSSTYDLRDPLPLSSNPRMSPEQKIFDALDTVDRKIETLYKSSIELSFSNVEDPTGSAQNLKPNQSFLFRSTSTTIKSPELSTISRKMQMEPCAAVNVGLIKSKTMSMDERNFPFICRPEHSMSTSDLLMVTVPLDEAESNEAVPAHGQQRDYQEIINETDKLIRRMNEAYGGPEEDQDDDYDGRIRGGEEEEEEEDSEAVKALMPESNYDLYEQITSEMEERQKALLEVAGLAKCKAEDVEEEEEEEGESIYQTVAEVKSAIRQAFDQQQQLNDEGSVNSYESCDNYEAIDELRRNYREEQKRLNGAADGYEICEPPEPPPPRKVSTTSADVQSGGPPPPQLPVPKRNKASVPAITKSTFYTPSPMSKDSLNQEEDEQHLAQTNNIFHSEHVYEENIYDTIKSSDNTSLLSNNYESISLIGRLNAASSSESSKTATAASMDKLKSGGGGADAMSYTSNCYESLRGSTLTINHLNGSGHPGNKFGKSDYYASSGLRHSESVSTLASDHKTNSIYGTTMHYATNHPGDRHSIAGTSSSNCSDTEVYSKMKHPPSENGTSYSSENSDEWVDISDGEEHTGGAAGGEGTGAGAGAEGDQMGGRNKLIV